MLDLIGRFLRSRRGNAAVVVSVALVPVLVGVGLAVDYSRALMARSHMQSSLDAGTLATARTEPGLSDAERIAIGKDVFEANFEGKFPGISATPQFMINGQQVTGTATMNLDNAIMGVFGTPETLLGTEAEVVVPTIGQAEVVFVLDYSSSMNDQYEPMRDAVISLIDTITLNRTSTDVKVGLVPFAKFVYGTLPGAHVLGGTTGVPWTNCTVGRKWPWVWKDSTPTGASDSKWGRTDGDDTIESDEYEDCDDHPDNNLIIRPLTTDHNGTVAQLNAMTPDSGTNIALGLEFGFHLISPNAPWTEGVSYNDPDWQKVIVLLSDGRHNKPGFGPGGIYTSNQGSDNLDLICAEAKNEEVLIITVAYELDDDEGKEQLENCASDSQYYLEGGEDNIATVFDGIGGLLIKEAYLSK